MAAGDSAWATQDPLSRRRLNRDWIIGRAQWPMFDDDINESTPSVTAKMLAGSIVTASIATYYTVPASGVAVTILNSLTLVNFSGTARTVNVHLVASGGLGTVSNQIFGASLQPGETAILQGPWFMAPGDTVRAVAASTPAITITGDLLELKTQPSSLTLKVIQGVLLGNTTSTYYTTPSSGVRQALLLSVSLYNDYAVGNGDLAMQVYRFPQGAGFSNAGALFAETMKTKQSAIFGAPYYLGPGDYIQASAGVASVSSARFTVVEMA